MPVWLAVLPPADFTDESALKLQLAITFIVSTAMSSD